MLAQHTRGLGIIRVVRVGDSACLDTLYSSYPLKLLPLASSDDLRCVQLYVIGHGGGLVSGDAINLQLTLENDSILVLKTQGSTKVYRGNARHDTATQEINANVCDDAFLVSVPDPVTCFRDSRLIQNQVYRLSEQASCIIVDSFTSGRAGNGEVWEASRISNRLQLFINDKLVFMENLDLQPTQNGMTISEKIGNCGVFGTVLLVGPKTLRLREGLQVFKERRSFKAHKSSLQQHKSVEDKNAGMLVSISDIPGGGVLRFSAGSTEDAYCFLAELFKTFATDIKLAQLPYMDRVSTDFLARRSVEW
jgi:urease accessory protein